MAEKSKLWHQRVGVGIKRARSKLSPTFSFRTKIHKTFFSFSSASIFVLSVSSSFDTFDIFAGAEYVKRCPTTAICQRNTWLFSFISYINILLAPKFSSRHSIATSQWYWCVSLCRSWRKKKNWIQNIKNILAWLVLSNRVLGDKMSNERESIHIWTVVGHTRHIDDWFLFLLVFLVCLFIILRLKKRLIRFFLSARHQNVTVKESIQSRIEKRHSNLSFFKSIWNAPNEFSLDVTETCWKTIFGRRFRQHSAVEINKCQRICISCMFCLKSDWEKIMNFRSYIAKTTKSWLQTTTIWLSAYENATRNRWSHTRVATKLEMQFTAREIGREKNTKQRKKMIGAAATPPYSGEHFYWKPKRHTEELIFWTNLYMAVPSLLLCVVLFFFFFFS